MKNITVIAFDADDTSRGYEHQIEHPAFYEMGNIADITSYLE